MLILLVLLLKKVNLLVKNWSEVAVAVVTLISSADRGRVSTSSTSQFPYILSEFGPNFPLCLAYFSFPNTPSFDVIV